MNDDDAIRWSLVGAVDVLDEEDVMRFDAGDRSYAIYRTPSGFYASDGHCTHEQADLADGFVIGDIIECPLHQGRFHIPSGKAKGAPVCIDLRTYPVKVEGSDIYIGLPVDDGSG